MANINISLLKDIKSLERFRDKVDSIKRDIGEEDIVVYFTINRDYMVKNFSKTSAHFISSKDYDLFTLNNGKIVVILEMKDIDRLSRYHTFAVSRISLVDFNEICNQKDNTKSKIFIDNVHKVVVYVTNCDDQILNVSTIEEGVNNDNGRTD